MKWGNNRKTDLKLVYRVPWGQGRTAIWLSGCWEVLGVRPRWQKSFCKIASVEFEFPQRLRGEVVCMGMMGGNGEKKKVKIGRKENGSACMVEGWTLGRKLSLRQRPLAGVEEALGEQKGAIHSLRRPLRRSTLPTSFSHTLSPAANVAIHKCCYRNAGEIKAEVSLFCGLDKWAAWAYARYKMWWKQKIGTRSEEQQHMPHSPCSSPEFLIVYAVGWSPVI